MKMIVFVVLAVMATALTAGLSQAEDKPQDIIVGKWSPTKEANKGMSLEFTKEGVIKVDIKAEGLSLDLKGTYKFIDDKTIEVTLENPLKKDEEKTDKLTIKSIAADKMVLIGPDGKEEEFKPVK
jgi:uncharacterized protein (TIGR03066 family)